MSINFQEGFQYHLMENEKYFQQILLEKLDIYMETNKVGTLLSTKHKNELRMIMDLNIKAKIIKPLLKHTRTKE